MKFSIPTKLASPTRHIGTTLSVLSSLVAVLAIVVGIGATTKMGRTGLASFLPSNSVISQAPFISRHYVSLVGNGENYGSSEAEKTSITSIDSSKDQVFVIGAGLGRTGTSSLKQALEILNYKPYHMDDCVKHDHAELWMNALDTGSIEQVVKEIVEKLGYNSFVDEPSTAFIPQLAARYPQAKIILTTRATPSSWVQSVRKLALIHEQLAKAPWTFVPNLRRFSTMAKRILAMRGCDVPKLLANDTEDCIQFYEQHEREMKDLYGNDNERFLEYRVQQGWKPLQAFLGDDNGIFPFYSPSEDVLLVRFPNSNGSDELLRFVMVLKVFRVVFFCITAVVAYILLDKHYKTARETSASNEVRMRGIASVIPGVNGTPGGIVQTRGLCRAVRERGIHHPKKEKPISDDRNQ